MSSSPLYEEWYAAVMEHQYQQPYLCDFLTDKQVEKLRQCSAQIAVDAFMSLAPERQRQLFARLTKDTASALSSTSVDDVISELHDEMRRATQSEAEQTRALNDSLRRCDELERDSKRAQDAARNHERDCADMIARLRRQVEELQEDELAQAQQHKQALEQRHIDDLVRMHTRATTTPDNISVASSKESDTEGSEPELDPREQSITIIDHTSKWAELEAIAQQQEEEHTAEMERIEQHAAEVATLEHQLAVLTEETDRRILDQEAIHRQEVQRWRDGFEELRVELEYQNRGELSELEREMSDAVAKLEQKMADDTRDHIHKVAALETQHAQELAAAAAELHELHKQHTQEMIVAAEESHKQISNLSPPRHNDNEELIDIVRSILRQHKIEREQARSEFWEHAAHMRRMAEQSMREIEARHNIPIHEEEKKEEQGKTENPPEAAKPEKKEEEKKNNNDVQLAILTQLRAIRKHIGPPKIIIKNSKPTTLWPTNLLLLSIASCIFLGGFLAARSDHPLVQMLFGPE